ncbi:hypothetical protein PWT90_08466 [Aphanocladium album]|nr:hypothetical protein PWT90_08466 [Aphanocladium album]
MAATSSPGLFSAPAPIKSLFKSFPLAVHPAEELPARAPAADDAIPRLYVFAREADAQRGLPSYNPSCLKWQLHTLYVNEANDTLLAELYLPSSALLRPAQRHALRAAATTEILKVTRRTNGGIDKEEVYQVAQEAFGALDALLGEDEWFLGAETPGVLDAEVFAYTHLLVGGRLAWADAELSESLREFSGLVRHAERLYQRCWGDPVQHGQEMQPLSLQNIVVRYAQSTSQLRSH